MCEGEEGVSKVRVCDRDKSTAGLEVLAVGTVTKVETGDGCESETFSSLLSAGVARIGTITSLTLEPLDLLKPAKVKLRPPPPSQPLLLDGRVTFPLKGRLGLPEGSLAPMWSVIKRTVISPGIHHTALNGGPSTCIRTNVDSAKAHTYHQGRNQGVRAFSWHFLASFYISHHVYLIFLLRYIDPLAKYKLRPAGLFSGHRFRVKASFP